MGGKRRSIQAKKPEHRTPGRPVQYVNPTLHTRSVSFYPQLHGAPTSTHELNRRDEPLDQLQADANQMKQDAQNVANYDYQKAQNAVNGGYQDAQNTINDGYNSARSKMANAQGTINGYEGDVNAGFNNLSNQLSSQLGSAKDSGQNAMYNSWNYLRNMVRGSGNTVATWVDGFGRIRHSVIDHLSNGVQSMDGMIRSGLSRANGDLDYYNQVIQTDIKSY